MTAADVCYYADHAIQQSAPVQENVRLARDTYRIRIGAPEIARRITPGQFLMVRLRSGDDPLLARPFALYDVVRGMNDAPEAVDLVYQIVGRMTSRLAACRPGQAVEVWGPLGNGFPPQECRQLIIVAGGIGYTPFLALAKEHLQQAVYGAPPRSVSRVDEVVFCYGVRSADYLASVDDFTRLGVDVRISTDDGSAGRPGLVTEHLRELLAEAAPRGRRIVSCGPEPMMAAVAELATRDGLPAQVSLETPMACGIGICFTCVARVRDAAGQIDYRRTCVEGPVFDAAQIDWSD